MNEENANLIEKYKCLKTSIEFINLNIELATITLPYQQIKKIILTKIKIADLVDSSQNVMYRANIIDGKHRKYYKPSINEDTDTDEDDDKEYNKEELLSLVHITMAENDALKKEIAALEEENKYLRNIFEFLTDDTKNKQDQQRINKFLNDNMDGIIRIMEQFKQ